MTEPAQSNGVLNPEIALHREAENLAQRFPGVDHEEIEDRVRSTYQQLKDEASVDTHLVAMTEGRVTEQLRQRGETVHVRGD
jgi:hypothetical protein